MKKALTQRQFENRFHTAGPESEGLRAVNLNCEWYHAYNDGTPAYSGRYMDACAAYKEGDEIRAKVRQFDGDWITIVIPKQMALAA